MQRDRWNIGRRVGACCMVLALEALFLQACTDLRVVRREMYAVIVQCIKNEILVEPEEGSFERHSSNRIYVPAAEAGRESGNFLCDGIVNHLKNRRHHSACGFSIAI